MIHWTYLTHDDNTARYTLGKLGKNMLFFVGINPSTARPDDLDRTVTRVENFSYDNGYDGWVMLNVYAQRATNPADMHTYRNDEIHTQNLLAIQSLVKQHPNFDICAAWGTEINRRTYLLPSLREVAKALGLDKRWVHLHALTKHKHPRHPLYLPATANIHDFNITEYLK